MNPAEYVAPEIAGAQTMATPTVTTEFSDGTAVATFDELAGTRMSEPMGEHGIEKGPIACAP